MNKDKFKQIQNEMIDKIKIPLNQVFLINSEDLIFTFDVQYTEDIGFVAIDIMKYNGQFIHTYIGQYPVTEEYHSGYFAFKEGPLLLKALNDLRLKFNLTPHLIIIDGHGQAHPRKMGIATWLGIQTNIPCIGVAKRTLIPFDYKNKLGILENAITPIFIQEEIVGYALRSQLNVKPIFVSSGHLISQKESLRIIKELKGKYRIIEPIRRADQKARKAAKGEIELDL